MALFSKKRRKNRRAKIKKLFKKAKNGIKRGLKGAYFAPLLPLKGLMKKALKRKGIRPKKRLPDLAGQFMKNIVRKGHFEESDNLIDDAIKIVTEIVGFFKKVKAKKKSGKPLTEEEETIADPESQQEFSEIQADVKAGVSDAKKEEATNFKFNLQGKTLYIVLGLAAIAGILIFRKK